MSSTINRAGARSLILGGAVMVLLAGGSASAAEEPGFPILSNEEAWQRLPAATSGGGQLLPSWARMTAAWIPRTTAAYLELDLAQRTASKVPAGLRAGMRWVAAHANRCAYAQAIALADAGRAGVDQPRLKGLAEKGFPGWSDSERAALEFASKMTVNSDSVTDAEFQFLVSAFGAEQAASMVLLMAYSNFQDRLLLCLQAPLEPADNMAPTAVVFPPEAYVVQTTAPGKAQGPGLSAATATVAQPDPSWKAQTYDVLQQKLQQQRQKPTRLRVPPWKEVAPKLPANLQKDNDIVWYHIVFGYAPELAVPFERVMRTGGAEAAGKWDRMLGNSMFWVVTKAVQCPYCMGHCEMNFEVAGLSRDDIRARTSLLAGDDWSAFKPSDQLALSFAKKLSRTPGEITSQDIAGLKQAFGPETAFLILFNCSRYHYMTRISNGFQLTLETENVFYDYWNQQAPRQAQLRSLTPCVSLLDNDECWKRLPEATSGAGQPLPSWARAVAVQLPRTAAAMLKLDYAQRTQSPVDPVLRGKMRWVIARENHCDYSMVIALADLKRLGVDAAALQRLQNGEEAWPESDREPLEFARLLTVAAPTVPDEMFEHLRKQHGDKGVAAMVLLAAYGNFQDRILLGLNLPLDAEGPMAPVQVEFAESAFQMAPFVPATSESAAIKAPGKTVVPEESDWSQVSYEELQARLEKQRNKPGRLPIPSWDQVKENLPPAMAAKPTRIIWNLVCSGYVPELAIPWSISTRTMWAEAHGDRVFEESLFWIQTRSIDCNYCMGHCEMLLEVAGLDKRAVADRTRFLAGNDWSMFSPAEQRSYAYARKLTRAPWKLTAEDYRTLEADLGEKPAMAIFWWLCRGLYMTRVSDGFQLPLERDNVFGH